MERNTCELKLLTPPVEDKGTRETERVPGHGYCPMASYGSVIQREKHRLSHYLLHLPILVFHS